MRNQPDSPLTARVRRAADAPGTKKAGQFVPGAAILSAGVVGYSRLIGEDEVESLAVLKPHRKGLPIGKAAQYHGRTITLRQS